MIDFHTHTFPDKIAPAAIGKLQGASHSRAYTGGTAAELTASMARSGVDWSVVLPVATNPVKAASMNDVSLKLNGQNGLVYFGCMHPDCPSWYEELGRIAAAGLKGVKLHPVYQGVDIDDVRNVRMLERAGDLGLTVVMHAGADIGFPGVVRCSPEMIARALKQAGPVRLICAHMGGWRNWQQVAEHLLETTAMLDTAFSLGSIAPLDDGYYAPEDLPMLGEEAFCHLVRTFGSKRVVFGTDSPWMDQAQSATQIEALPLTQAEKDDIFDGNARRILGL